MKRTNLKKMDLQLFAMKNLDVLQQKKAEIANKLREAMEKNDEQAFAQAFEEYTNILQEAVLAEARGLVHAQDNAILARRGVRVLTSEERNYYEKVIEAMKSKDPKQALTGFGEVLPKTVINAVFEDITESHPLLSVINFQNAEALVEYLYSSMDGRFKAIWGKLCSEITQQLAASFHKINFGQNKLSAFIPVCKAMLDLGPEWLDRYVRTILYEAIANGLEDGIINGRGVAEGDPVNPIYEPIGMIKDLTAFNVNLGYADKAPIPMIDFSPENYGNLIALMAVGPNGLSRDVSELILICNPVDYFTKVMPAVMYQQPDGTWVSRFPFPTRVIKSVWVLPGQAIIGIAKRYFAVLGTGKDGRIEYSDEYKFLEDERVYLIKLYGTGRPLDNTSFLLLDISGLTPVPAKVFVVNNPLNIAGNVGVNGQPIEITGILDARLSNLTIGELTLTPAFNKSVHVYDVTTTNASDVITAVAKDGDSTISIKVNNVAHTNGTAATWEAGNNTVEITVLNVLETETYTVTVTCNAA